MPMTTRLEANDMFYYPGKGTRIEHSSHVIRGTESPNGNHRVTLFTTTELCLHSVYLHVVNHADYAGVVVNTENKPEGMPELHAAIDQTPLDVTEIDHQGNMVRVDEGQTFSIWFGGETFEARDVMLGSAQFTWTNQEAV
jgi:hypothetical protein